ILCEIHALVGLHFFTFTLLRSRAPRAVRPTFFAKYRGVYVRSRLMLTCPRFCDGLADFALFVLKTGRLASFSCTQCACPAMVFVDFVGKRLFAAVAPTPVTELCCRVRYC